MILKKLLPVLLLSATLVCGQKMRELKPGFNMFSVEQDIQLGKESAAQIEKQYQVITDRRVNDLIQRIGQKLVSAADTGTQFPFTFKVVNDPSINAFALPGGPMFIHTGLIAAADNEAQIAGVMGHEMAHVILRHGTNQASKANLIQIPAAIAAGVFDRGGMLGSLTQLGVGLGANSVLLKFSRNAERDADLLGARMMSRAGYNPIELASFFEKLESESGKGNFLTQFMSDHPNPGNRVKSIQDDMRFYPKSNYATDSASPALTTAKSFIQTLPKPVKKAAGGAATAPAPANGQGPTTQAPANFKVFSSALYAIAYPDDWQAQLAEDRVSGQLAAADGIVKGQNGNDVGHGVLLSVAQTQSQDLNRETENYLQTILQGNQGVRKTGEAQRVNVAGTTGLLTPLEGQSGLKRGEKERIQVLTVLHPRGLFTAIMIAPESRWTIASQEYDQMMRSIKF